MGALEWITAAGLMFTIAGGLLGILNHFLSARDAAQQREIEDLRKALTEETSERRSINAMLFQKHDEDANHLRDLKEKIAGNHYEKPELDRKFDKIEKAITDGFLMLNSKFDMLGCGKSKQSCATGDKQ
jgi:hypothetical protein